MTDSTPERFAVQNQDRTLVFDGIVLGHASSRAKRHTRSCPAGCCRWAEITIYRTVSGTYVVAGAGKTIIEGETPRCWAHVVAEASGVVAALYLYDEYEVRYMTRVARRALRQAMQNDEAIERAFMVEEVA